MNHSIAGKTIYGLIFMALLPILLITWAANVENRVALPAVQSAGWGAALAGVGGFLLLAGMYALWHFGKGLPMNAYPPVRFVTKGAYRLVPHPIYLGFLLVCFGSSLFLNTAAGLWLVSPVTALGCIALVWGFERIDLQRRFPGQRGRYWLMVPPDESGLPTWSHRLSVYACVLFPWVLGNAAAGWVWSPGSSLKPVFQLPEALTLPPAALHFVGVAAALWMMLAPLLARSGQQLRQFFLSGLAGGATTVYLAFFWPEMGLAHWLILPGNAWTQATFSYCWFWIWPAGLVYEKAYPGMKPVWRGVALLLSIGLVAGSVDPFAHTLTGGFSLFVALFYPLLWEFLREKAEAVANSWKEWTFGPVRIINHGFYVGFGAFAGVFLGTWLAGETYTVPIVVFGAIGTVCAGLWGQFIEGSEKLKRPFGYYGILPGIVIGSLVMYWMRVPVWVVLGLFSVFLPWVQAIGRLRCLVNGCCHGSEANEQLGIRYIHPRSRVCFISGLKGKPLHPTPLYSMLWLALVGGVQLRLWQEGVALSLIFGLYLILTGLGRFVEEAYRGEPQTPVWGKLRLYQWTAVFTILAGILVTFLAAPMPELVRFISWKTIGWGLCMWAFVQFLMGIDFPRSQRRFSRLT